MKKYTNKILFSVLGIAFLTVIIVFSIWVYRYNHMLLPGQQRLPDSIENQVQRIRQNDTSDSDCINVTYEVSIDDSNEND